VNCVADDFIDARWQIEAAPDEHTEMRSQPAHQSLLNRRLDGSASGTAQPLNSALACSCNRIAQPCPASLTTNIRVPARELASVMGLRESIPKLRLAAGYLLPSVIGAQAAT
jgi:hypothetical protein